MQSSAQRCIGLRLGVAAPHGVCKYLYITSCWIHAHTYAIRAYNVEYTGSIKWFSVVQGHSTMAAKPFSRC